MRNRSSAFAITDNAKKRMTQELGITDDTREETSKKIITNYMEDKIKENEELYDKSNQSNQNYRLNFQAPQYLDIKKEYVTVSGSGSRSKTINNDKPIKFHEKARVFSTLDKNYTSDIVSHSQKVNFNTFLGMFKNDDEIEELEIQDLLNIDYEKIGELKERASNLTEITSSLPSEEGNDELLVFLCEKLNEIKKNEINIQVFINNLNNVESVEYSGGKTDVYFN